MNRPGVKDKLTLADAARACGVSYEYMRKLRRLGRIPHHINPLTGLPYLLRAELLEFMRLNGYSEEMCRPWHQPRSGQLIGVGLEPAHKAAIFSSRTTYVGSLIRLGVLLATTPSWCIVFDLRSLGRLVSIEAANELASLGDHPLMVGIAEPDHDQYLFVAHRFDLLLKRPLSGQQLARTIQGLRSSMLNAPSVADRSGRWKRSPQENDDEQAEKRRNLRRRRQTYHARKAETDQAGQAAQQPDDR